VCVSVCLSVCHSPLVPLLVPSPQCNGPANLAGMLRMKLIDYLYRFVILAFLCCNISSCLWKSFCQTCVIFAISRWFKTSLYASIFRSLYVVLICHFWILTDCRIMNFCSSVLQVGENFTVISASRWPSIQSISKNTKFQQPNQSQLH